MKTKIKKQILVTGGAGYIGSHMVLKLLNSDFEPVVIDNLSTGNLDAVKTSNIVIGDLRDKDKINYIFANYKIDAVIHFAGLSVVSDSLSTPIEYYENNVVSTINLVQAMLKNNVNKIVFSSSASVYGIPKYIPIDENHIKSPINTYGWTKLMIENLLNDFSQNFNLKTICLRYFNAAGASQDGSVGEIHNPETHLIPNILKSAISSRDFILFGDDFETRDGFCVRDFVHVEDLCDAHLIALKKLNNQKKGFFDAFNLGTNQGHSTKEVFDVAKRLISNDGFDLEYSIYNRRAGDPPALIANNTRAINELGWSPKFSLEEMIKHAWEWEKNCNSSP